MLSTSRNRKIAAITVMVAAIVALSLVVLISNNKKLKQKSNDVEQSSTPTDSLEKTFLPTDAPSDISFDDFMSGSSKPSSAPSSEKLSSSPSTTKPSPSPSMVKITTTPPVVSPTDVPTLVPSLRPTTIEPTRDPTSLPTTPVPSLTPTQDPTSVPTLMPTPSPTRPPTAAPVPMTSSPVTSPPSIFPPSAFLDDRLSEPPNDTTTTITPTRFYAIGDVPYTPREATQLAQQMQTLPDDAEFLIHVGDIRSARDGSTCTINEYTDVANILLQSHAPVFLVIGDNEWNDCPNVNQGFAHWHNVFGNFEEKWTNHGLDVVRPSDRPENFAFVHKQTLYIGLNLVGGRLHHLGEWTARLQDQLLWVQELVDSYVSNTNSNGTSTTKSVVIFGHANPTNDHAEFFNPLADYIEELNNNDDVAFLYLNGDAHVWNYQPNFFGTSQFLRIQVEGGTRDPPVAITVNGNGGAGNPPSSVFSYDRLLLE